MAKVSGPLFSLDARGQVGKAIVFSYWKGVNYVRSRVVPNNPQSVLQTAIRDLIKDVSEAWKTNTGDGTTTIDASYKSAYDVAAAGTGISGFNLYIKDCVGKNGGSSYSGTMVTPTAVGDNS